MFREEGDDIKMARFLVFLCLLLNFSGLKSEDFVATDSWQEIQEGQKVPAGLHYRINLETGKKEAKILDDSNAKKNENAPIIASSENQNDEEELEKISPERLKEMQDILAKLNMNKDVENIKTLMANFDNSSQDAKLAILEDLDFYMHQIDNARDFVTLNGLTQIIRPALTCGIMEIVAKAAIVLGSSAQANPQVQNAIFNTPIPQDLLELLLKSDSDPQLIRRVIFALSAMTRGNAQNVEKMKVLGGFKILQKVLENHQDDLNLVLKGLTLITDLMQDEIYHSDDESWCLLIQSDFLYDKPDLDLDLMEKWIQSLQIFQEKLCSQLVQTGKVQKFLKSARFKLWKKNDQQEDFKTSIESINKLLATLKKDEL